MNYIVLNPFHHKLVDVNPDVLKIFLRETEGRTRRPTMGDFWSNLGNTLTDGIAGLTTALGGALTAIVSTVAQIGETISLVIRAALGQVSWSDVLGSIGKVFQDIGTAMVFLDPTRQVYNWLSTAPLTAHAFHELDKFTGGTLTNVANLSDLPGRVLRGDAISKQELLRDALFAIEVVVMIVTFPEGLAMMVGMMVGQQVCSHQTEARSACMAAFVIAGAAVGEYWAGEEDSFLASLQDSGLDFLDATGINSATRLVVQLCEQDQWAGKRECAIMGQVLSDYLKQYDPEEPTDWAEFLGTELAKIGEQDLILALYPPNSRESTAILAHKPKTAVQPAATKPKSTGMMSMFYDSTTGGLNPLAYLLLAGGALLAIGGAT